MPPGFSQVFGGNTIYPVQPTYTGLTYATNLILAWPIEQAIAGNLVVSDIIDLNPGGPGLTVQMPDARMVSTGFAVLFNNIGGQTTTILDNTGATLLPIVPGSVWEIYLVDNTTQGGTWRVFQFGASISTAVATALAGAGLTAIGATLNEQEVIQPKSVSYTVLNSDRATILQWTAGVGTFTLPAPGIVGAAWFVQCKNSGAGNLTLNTITGNIDGSPTATLAPGGSAIYVTDGSNYYSLYNGGTVSSGSFNLLAIDVTGSGTFTLSGPQLNQIGYKFTGVLSGNRTIIVPNTTQEYWVDNETTGAFTLAVSTVGQVSPPTVPQNNRYILYCDGGNVINALTNSVVFPILVAQGGTGSTTAGGALTNLGGTTVGVALFTAASSGAALTTLGGTAVGTSLFTAGSTTAALTNLGGTAVGIALFTAISAAAGRTTLGATTVGSNVFTAVSAAAACTAIGAVPTTTSVFSGTGLTGGGALSANVTLNVDFTKVAAVSPTQNVQSPSSNYTFALSDNGNVVIANAAGSGGTWTIPPNSSVNFPLDASIVVMCGGTGPFTIAPGAGVTLVLAGPGATGSRTINADAVVVLIQASINFWFITGSGIT